MSKRARVYLMSNEVWSSTTKSGVGYVDSIFYVNQHKLSSLDNEDGGEFGGS